MGKKLNVELELLKEIHSAGVGAVLRSYATYAKQLGCKVHEVRSAMLRLADQGVVQLRPRGKTIVLSSSPVTDDVGLGFSERAMKLYGSKVNTRILELVRRPLRTGKQTPFETSAREFLELGDRDDAYVISRLRLLDRKPRVIHRVYLCSDRFPDTFLDDHDFRTESLMKIYADQGYVIQRRITTLSARYSTSEEMQVLEIDRMPVLEAQQQTIALDPATGKEVNWEYLVATYVDWKYRVERRSGSD